MVLQLDQKGTAAWCKVMRKVTKKISNFQSVKIGPLNNKVMSASKTTIVLNVTKASPKENFPQGLQQVFDVMTGFVKWKHPDTKVLQLEIKTKSVRFFLRFLRVKGEIKSDNSHPHPTDWNHQFPNNPRLQEMTVWGTLFWWTNKYFCIHYSL